MLECRNNRGIGRLIRDEKSFCRRVTTVLCVDENGGKIEALFSFVLILLHAKSAKTMNYFVVISLLIS